MVGETHVTIIWFGWPSSLDWIVDLDEDDRLLWWVYLGGKHGKLESWTSSWRHGAWQSYAGTLCRSTCIGVTYGHPMRSAKAGMLCGWIRWCDVEMFYLWANGEVFHSCTIRPWTWLDLWADYGALLLHGEPRHLAGTFKPIHVCLLGCWLEMTHGAHGDMRLWLFGTSYYGVIGGSDALRSLGQGLWCSMCYILLSTFMGVLERVTWCGGSIWDTLEWWSCSDDDALVATLGHGLSRDLTTFDTWDLIGLWSWAAHGWWCWDRCGWFHAAHWYQTSWVACCRQDGVYFMDLGMAYLDGDGFLIELML